ncbi:MAG: hypothetical protein ACI35O_09310 [Bacillaceae bacterium]
MKKMMWGISIIILVALFITLYLFFKQPTKLFISAKQQTQMAKDIESSKIDVQTVVYLGKKHAFAPLLINDNQYGGSYWQWKWGKWQLLCINTSEPFNIWKVSDAKQYVIWNVPKEPTIAKSLLVLKTERDYFMTDNKSFYYPEIKLTKEIAYTDATYGVMSVPKEWKEILKSRSTYTPSVTNFLLQQQAPQDFFYQIVHLNKYEQDIFPSSYDFNSSFIFDDIQLESILPTSKEEAGIK